MSTTLLTDPDRARAAAVGERTADVVVIGAGQAGLSAAYHLQRRGYGSALEAPSAADSSLTADSSPTADSSLTADSSPAADSPATVEGPRSFVVLDGEDGPGGAWRHRWDSLRMATVNGIHDLPGMEQAPPDPAEPSNAALPRYFARYEEDLAVPVVRPVRVQAVERVDADPHGRLRVRTDRGTWLTRAVVNATGTWGRPYWPYYPGRETFLGEQLHTADYVSAEAFRGRHVVVVGGGISAVQFLEELSQVTSTTWVTRREPVWRDGPFGPDEGREAVAKVEERVRAGLPPRSVVSVTGLLWTPAARAAAARGALDRRPMFERIEPDGVRWADGSVQQADVILWATGFRAELDHLSPLRLRGRGGGIVMDSTRVAAEPRVHLVGYGPSSSTIGANRAGRDAVREIDDLLTAR